MTMTERLKAYGDFRLYRTGEGYIEIDSDEHECLFTLVQLCDGDLIIGCEFDNIQLYPLLEGAQRVRGLANGGARLETEGRLVLRSKTFDSGPPGGTGIWHVRAAKLYTGTTDPSTWHYALTNLLPVAGPVSLSFSTLRLVPAQNHTALAKEIKRERGVNVTYHLETDGKEPSDELVADLCSVLSIATGTWVTWIERAAFDENGELVNAYYASRVTRGWCPLSIADLTDAEVLEQWLRNYRSNAKELDLREGIVKMYIDAKAGGPYFYLEARAVILCICLEMLRNSVAQSEGASVIPENHFDSIRPTLVARLSETLLEMGLSADDVKGLATEAKLRGLNRRSFAALLGRLLKKINLKVSSEDRKRVLAYRNKLVHEGQFYCQAATQEQREKVPTCADETEEFFFLLEFMDRLMLAMLDPSLQPIPFREQ